MRVLHFSITPLAGMPIRLVQALNRHTGVSANLVDLKRHGLYDHDLVFEENPDQALDLAQKADVIHLHNYLDYQSKHFAPIDFAALKHQGKAIVRQFHTEPNFVAAKMGLSPEALLAQDIPCLAVAQHPERLYPKAMVVPNFVPENQPAYQPQDAPTKWDVFFGPTMYLSAWEDRWNTKAVPEVKAVLDDLAARTGCRVRPIEYRPLPEILREKQASRIVVDDLVTGSYHLTGLEALSQAKPVLAYLDNRTQDMIRHFSQVPDLPFLNIRLEDAREVLEHLVADPLLCQEIGAYGRDWLTRHWPEKLMIGHYLRAYELLLEDPSLVRRQPELSLHSPAKYFLAKTLPDLIYQARRKAVLG